ncbi:MAG: amidohydrolase family protein, partial [Pseudomonadota bacterium]
RNASRAAIMRRSGMTESDFGFRTLLQNPGGLFHAGSPHDRSPAGIAAWKNELRHLSALSNVTCKLSGLGMFDHHWTAQSIKPIVEICLEQFGPDRCMFGSNFPVDSLYSDYAKLMTAYETLIPEQDKPAVFFETARQFYVMDVAA